MSSQGGHFIALGPVSDILSWYGLALLLAICVCWWWSQRSIAALADSPQSPSPPSIAPALLWVLVGGFLGAKFAHSGLFAGLGADSILEVGRSGGSIYGVFAGGFLALAAYSRIARFPLLKLVDKMVLIAPVCVAIVRLGNLFNDELWGDLTEWDLIPRHPSQLYEGALCLVLVLPVLAWLATRPKLQERRGYVTGAFLIMYSLIRLLVDFTRHNTLLEMGESVFTLSLVAAFLSMSIGIYLVYSSYKRRGGTDDWSAHFRAGNKRSFGQVACMSGTIAVITIGCGGPIENVPNPPLPSTEIGYSNPDADSRCTCAGARAAFVRHRENGPRRITWVTYRTDRISGEEFNPQDGVEVIDPGMPGRFVGCTIDAPQTSCRFDVRYNVRYTQAPLAIREPSLRNQLGSIAYTGERTCSAICSAQGGAGCLQLGVRFYQAVAPLAELIRQANTNGQNVPKAVVLQRLGIQESDDTCGRGDILIQNGLARNIGTTEICQFPSRDLSRPELQSVGLTYNRAAPLRMIGVLPRVTLVRAGGAIRSIYAQETAVAVDDAHAPFLTFDGAGGSAFSGRYGGPIQSIARIAVPGRPRQTVISTSNGCIAVAER